MSIVEFDLEMMMNHEQNPTDVARWQAVVARNRQADGDFVYAVSTTGIYCRPWCPSRLPRRKNVQFFDAWQTAEEAGFRPCKRCVPQKPDASDTAVDAVVQACKMIEEAEKAPTLNQLAAAVGLSPYYFHRLFKKTVGVTPKQYALEKRLHRVRSNLQGEGTITEAIYNAGYESGSRFYEDAKSSLGMKASEYQKGGQGLLIHYAIVQSYLGWVLVAATGQGVCQIDFGDSPEILLENLKGRFPEANLNENDLAFGELVGQVLTFLEMPNENLTLPLDIQGTAFQRRVWATLQNIPPGSTASYANIAARIGQPKAARAVAQACASNKIAVAIPCHRVVRSDGKLGGYRWGLERKRVILEREANESSRP